MKNNQKLVLWDVGLGAAHNAMAAIYACEAEQAGSLQIESFENDIDALRLALKYGNYFKHLDHEAPRAIAQNKKYISEKINWRLIEGDFLSTMAFAKKPDVIFFDPFSFKTDTELWTLECFEKMVSFIQDQEKWVELYTYSNSTGVRAALLGAGFFVAPGISTGVKTATTVAFLPPKQLTITSISELPERFKNRFQFYGEEWIRKWQISSSKFPYNLSDGRQQAFEASIIKHAQFR